MIGLELKCDRGVITNVMLQLQVFFKCLECEGCAHRIVVLLVLEIACKAAALSLLKRNLNQLQLSHIVVNAT